MAQNGNNRAPEAGSNKRRKRVLIIGGGLAGMVWLLSRPAELT